MPKPQPKPAAALSIDAARRIALRAQGLMQKSGPRRPVDVLRQLGYVQLDTISVLARSHELVAYARLGATPRPQIESAYWNAPAVAFEYYGHANCVMPIELWPYFAYKRRANADASHPWFSVHEQAVDEVRARLKAGPVTATDLGGARQGNGGWWSWSESKIAVELLYYRGEAVCTTRQGWKRVYDLPERVIPMEYREDDPSDEECLNHLVALSARSIGVGTKRDIMEVFRLTRGWQNTRIPGVLFDNAIEAAGLVPVSVEGWKEIAYASPDALATPVKGDSRTTLLSPFDSLIWDRKIAKRTQRLFGFSYELEAYVPKDKRQYGYFVMPLLAHGRLVGRVDPARRGRTLIAHHVSLEDPAEAPSMAAALREAATWVGCDHVEIADDSPAAVKALLRSS